MSSRSVNKCIFIGHLGRDAETKFTPSGVAKVAFSIAVNKRWKDQQSGEWMEKPNWVNVVLWRQEKLANYLIKGKQVYVEGEMETRTYEREGQKHTITEINAREVILLGGVEQQTANSPDPSKGEWGGASDEDVPF